MNAHELFIETREIAKAFGPNAYVSLSVSNQEIADQCVYAVFYPEGVCGGHQIYMRAGTFEDALTALREKIATESSLIRANRTREMALKIITTTFETGSCSDAALRGHGFSQSEIDMLGEDATAQANDMSDRRPFAIKRLQFAGNGAPAMQAAE